MLRVVAWAQVEFLTFWFTTLAVVQVYPLNCETVHVGDGFLALMCDSALAGLPPPSFEFLVILTFLHHGIEKVEGHLVWELHTKIQRKMLSKLNINVPPKLFACTMYRVSIQSCTQNRPSPKAQLLSRDWISLFNCLEYLHENWHTCSACSWLQHFASNLLNFAQGPSYGL